jgi:hypothetical protein
VVEANDFARISSAKNIGTPSHPYSTSSRVSLLPNRASRTPPGRSQSAIWLTSRGSSAWGP